MGCGASAAKYKAKPEEQAGAQQGVESATAPSGQAPERRNSRLGTPAPAKMQYDMTQDEELKDEGTQKAAPPASDAAGAQAVATAPAAEAKAAEPEASQTQISQDISIVFEPSEDLGLEIDDGTGEVTQVVEGGQAARLGVQVGWVMKGGTSRLSTQLTTMIFQANGAKTEPPAQEAGKEASTSTTKLTSLVQKSSEQEHTVVFQPGADEGLEVDFETGKVTKVEIGSQADKFGIQVGWVLCGGKSRLSTHLTTMIFREEAVKPIAADVQNGEAADKAAEQNTMRHAIWKWDVFVAAEALKAVGPLDAAPALDGRALLLQQGSLSDSDSLKIQEMLSNVAIDFMRDQGSAPEPFSPPEALRAHCVYLWSKEEVAAALVGCELVGTVPEMEGRALLAHNGDISAADWEKVDAKLRREALLFMQGMAQQ